MTLPEKLVRALQRPATLRIAVSGGVDSLCLAAAAATVRGTDELELCHATSPAVPGEATARVRSFAAARNLKLNVVDAGEFADERYRANPVDRCYFCKSNLYRTLSNLARTMTVAAGTNLDDLGDYRPGLVAAAEHEVIHPFVEAGMDKAAIRALARELDLREIAELPAAPCLASRVETGLRVEPAELVMIDAVESALRADLGRVTLRSRRLRTGIAIELDTDLMAGLSQARLDALTDIARKTMERHDTTDLAISIRPYRRGSAFVHA